MADIFDIVADSTRREILQVLLEAQASGSGEVAVSQIVQALELSQPTVSKHLKVLRDSGLVRVREEGQHRYYHLDSSPLEEVDEWLLPFLGAAEDEGQADATAIGAASSVGFGATGLSDSQKEFAASVGKVAAGAAARAAALASRVKR
ncbi:ArsR/SmtB family transcription factor [Gryllotalpicola protaetiae]|uniref:ArsR family transcriptional regulator n=1 Tax=Gryllotalpicola protaetiae TaxID=2419771 RepID=A0A387BS45_9MICO|nr:metalloregulator ArsR/SmtB family transcription factor [Gryllotalpicola protaetiae]AYG03826.1 ArsR family transcriptional regulator [Gryllotalpicola protaetiae]